MSAHPAPEQTAGNPSAPSASEDVILGTPSLGGQSALDVIQASADGRTSCLTGMQERLQGIERDRTAAREPEQRKRRLQLPLTGAVLLVLAAGVAASAYFAFDAKREAKRAEDAAETHAENGQPLENRVLTALLVEHACLRQDLKPKNGEVQLDRDLASQWASVKEPREIPAKEVPELGKGNFSFAMWLKVGDKLDWPTGDLLSRYDSRLRRGYHLTLKSSPGVTSNQPNDRHLQFGIDDNRATDWRDCGRPGNALFAFSMAVHEGSLYVGTCEPGKDESGRVYRHAGGQKWIDCGAPDRSNAVTAMAVFQGKLHVGTGKYRVAGSSLKESENLTLGGRVYRYEGGTRWPDCGPLPQTEAVGGLVVFQGQFYASSLYKPAGFFRYDGEKRWTSLAVPEAIDPKTKEKGPRRVVPLTIHEGHIYAGSYDGGHVYRFDGKVWTDCGQLGDNTQTYSFAQYHGRLYVGTWPSGRVYRFDGTGKWIDVGRLGGELEVMGMLVHNGRLIAGTLPLGEVYSYEGETTWKKLVRLDHTPDVKYRRVWTMAEHDGQLFASTLPSGKIFAFSAGEQAMWGHSLPSGWRHVAAVKSANRLTLFVDGERVSQTPPFDAASYLVDTNQPLRLGTGTNGPLNGTLADVRIYRRALDLAEIEALAKLKPME